MAKKGRQEHDPQGQPVWVEGEEFKPGEALPLAVAVEDKPAGQGKPVEGKPVEPDLAVEEQREKDPLQKEVWAKMGRLKAELATLELQEAKHAKVLDRIRVEMAHREAQFKCLRGFVNWEAAMKRQLSDNPPEYDVDDPEHDLRDEAVRTAEEGKKR